MFMRRYGDFTLDHATESKHCGLMGAKDFDRYIRLWTWGAVRYTGTAAHEQGRYLSRHGRAALLLRIARVSRLFAA